MSIPLIQIYRVGRYILEQKFRGVKRYPLVLMLEPLFQCNLACAGCGKIDYPAEILQKRVSTEDALKAVDECGAPVVSIPGGEPLIHKEMPAIVRGIIARKKFVYLCTMHCCSSRKSMSMNLHRISPGPCTWMANVIDMMNPSVARAYSRRRSLPFSRRSTGGFESR